MVSVTKSSEAVSLFIGPLPWAGSRLMTSVEVWSKLFDIKTLSENLADEVTEDEFWYRVANKEKGE